jgi:hypothetical protein
MSPGSLGARVGRRWFAAVVVLGTAMVAALAGRGPALAADEGPYPVWWSPVLELDSLDHVEQRLDRRLWKDDDLGLEMKVHVDGRRLSAYANSCRMLEKLLAEGFYAATGQGYKSQLWHIAKCSAIELLGQAKPARTSFVRDFVLNADVLYSMPAPPDGPSCYAMCRQLYANDRGVPWSAFDTVDRVEVEDENTIKVLEYGWARKFQLVGRADVNGRDIEHHGILFVDKVWPRHGPEIFDSGSTPLQPQDLRPRVYVAGVLSRRPIRVRIDRHFTGTVDR